MVAMHSIVTFVSGTSCTTASAPSCSVSGSASCFLLPWPISCLTCSRQQARIYNTEPKPAQKSLHALLSDIGTSQRRALPVKGILLKACEIAYRCNFQQEDRTSSREVTRNISTSVRCASTACASPLTCRGQKSFLSNPIP